MTDHEASIRQALELSLFSNPNIALVEKSDITALLAELDAMRDVLQELARENGSILAERDAALTRASEAEADRALLNKMLAAWRERFHAYEYRPQDDCVAMKLRQHDPDSALAQSTTKEGK